MFKRFRRLRSSENLRALVRESALSVDDLIYPLFVVDGKGVKNEVGSPSLKIQIVCFFELHP